MIEEGQPDFLEQNLNVILRKADLQTKVHGKDMLPMAGEYTPPAVIRGILTFVETYGPQLIDRQHLPTVVRPAERQPKAIQAAEGLVPPRPPSFCTGCPERPIFAAIKLVEREIGQHHISCEDTCTGDHSCIRLSGCPSLTVRPTSDPLRQDPVATVIDSCIGCGLCGEVAHAAKLCPSFFRMDVVSNPTGWEGFTSRVRSRVIAFLQRRIDRRLAGFAA